MDAFERLGWVESHKHKHTHRGDCPTTIDKDDFVNSTLYVVSLYKESLGIHSEYCSRHHDVVG